MRVRVALLCVNPWDRPGTYQPFSFGAFRVATAVREHPDVDEVRVFDAYHYDVDRIEQEVEEFDPDVVGASGYVWSLPLFTELLARLRRRRPERVIVLGGPSARPEMLDLAPYTPLKQVLDAVVVSDGEVVFRELIDHRAGGGAAFVTIPGLALPTSGGWRRTAPRAPIKNLDLLPSPFQTGFAPHGKSAHLETFRGCPLSCKFCEWGAANDASGVFSADYIERELRAFEEMGCTSVHQVDAGLNLNAKAFKNLAAAEERVGLLQRLELNCEIYPTLLTPEQVEFLQRSRARIGVGLQTYNPEVLKAIDRPFQAERLDRCLEQITQYCHTTSTIILGLPTDNPRSFRETLARSLALPSNLRVYHCLVLPDALMTRNDPSWNLEFDPYTLQLLSCSGWSRSDLQREWDNLNELVEKHHGVSAIQPLGGNQFNTVTEFGNGYAGSTSTYWYFPLQECAQAERERPHSSTLSVNGARTPMPWSPQLLARATATTGGAWRVEGEGIRDGRFFVSFGTPVGQVDIVIEPLRPGTRYFRAVNGTAFSYMTMGGAQLHGRALAQCAALVDEMGQEVHLPPDEADQSAIH